MTPGKESAEKKEYAKGETLRFARLKKIMSSSLRINSSRANGAKSRGPTTVAGRLASLANSAKSTGPSTPEGQARSAQNAIRHGILAESIVLDSESAERFSEVLSALQEELQPASSIESRYVETMALAEWRRLRLICIEKEQFTIETRRQEAADLSLTNDGNAGDAGDAPPKSVPFVTPRSPSAP